MTVESSSDERLMRSQRLADQLRILADAAKKGLTPDNVRNILGANENNDARLRGRSSQGSKLPEGWKVS